MPYKNLEIFTSKNVQYQSIKTEHFYKGFSSAVSSGMNSRLYDLELVKQDLINHFNTRKGSRVMNPNFGCIIWDLLMEPLTEEVTEALRTDITRICNSDSRVTPLQIDLFEYDSGYILEISLQLVGTDQSTQLIINFNQQLGI
jgi:phage baseplate assembly protein W